MTDKPKTLKDVFTKIPDRPLINGEKIFLDMHKVEVHDYMPPEQKDSISPEVHLTSMAIAGKSKDEMNAWIKANQGNWQKANEEFSINELNDDDILKSKETHKDSKGITLPGKKKEHEAEDKPKGLTHVKTHTAADGRGSSSIYKNEDGSYVARHSYNGITRETHHKREENAHNAAFTYIQNHDRDNIKRYGSANPFPKKDASETPKKDESPTPKETKKESTLVKTYSSADGKGSSSIHKNADGSHVVHHTYGGKTHTTNHKSEDDAHDAAEDAVDKYEASSKPKVEKSETKEEPKKDESPAPKEKRQRKSAEPKVTHSSDGKSHYHVTNDSDGQWNVHHTNERGETTVEKYPTSQKAHRVGKEKIGASKPLRKIAPKSSETPKPKENPAPSHEKESPDPVVKLKRGEKKSSVKTNATVRTLGSLVKKTANDNPEGSHEKESPDPTVKLKSGEKKNSVKTGVSDKDINDVKKKTANDDGKHSSEPKISSTHGSASGSFGNSWGSTNHKVGSSTKDKIKAATAKIKSVSEKPKSKENAPHKENIISAYKSAIDSKKKELGMKSHSNSPEYKKPEPWGKEKPEPRSAIRGVKPVKAYKKPEPWGKEKSESKPAPKAAAKPEHRPEPESRPAHQSATMRFLKKASDSYKKNISDRGGLKGILHRAKKVFKEEHEPLSETLGPDASVEDWIKDFMYSTDPRFDGKSSKERRKQAIAAYMAKKKDMKEDSINELSDKDTLNSYIRKSKKDVETKLGIIKNYKKAGLHKAAEGLMSKVGDRLIGQSGARKRLANRLREETE